MRRYERSTVLINRTSKEKFISKLPAKSKRRATKQRSVGISKIALKEVDPLTISGLIQTSKKRCKEMSKLSGLVKMSRTMK